MKLNNYFIHQSAIALASIVKDANLYIPAKVNYYLQKNIELIAQTAQAIEEQRLTILNKYGVPTEDNTNFTIPSENTEIVNKELFELFSVEQELNIMVINLSDLENASFNSAQMQALMFMIQV